MNKDIEKLQNLLQNCRKIVVITGAGISTPSGIPDIRSSTGAQNNKSLKERYKYDYETIVSNTFFLTHTQEFYRYYKEQMVYKNALPNAAHKFLKDLEIGHDVTIITQNIDGLHKDAGSKKVIEVHGTTKRYYCMNCGKQFDLDYVMNSDNVPICDKCGGIIKPDVVLFEESLDEFAIEASIEALGSSDLLIVIGSSLVVNPVAMFPYYFKGTHFVIINRDPTPLDRYAELVINENVISVFNQIILK